MTNVYVTVRKWILAKIQKEDAISSLIKFAYFFFNNEYVQASISLIGTVAIGVMTAFKYFNAVLWITIVVYCGAVLLMAWANRYRKEKMNEARLLKQALIGMDIVLRTWGIKMQKCAQKLKDLSLQADRETIKRILTETDFQAAAFLVCEKLCDSLSKYCENDDVYVTLYQKFKERDELECKMIAYSGDHEPSTYDVVYSIPKNSENLMGKIEYHTYVFAANNKDISTFCNSGEVEAAFVLHEKSKDREEEIQQYICAPIAPAKQGVTFLLQIDTRVPDLFGKDKESVDRFAKIAIYPFAQFLHMMYEQSRTIGQLTK